MNSQITTTVMLDPPDSDRLRMLCGPMDDNLRLIEKRLGVSISSDAGDFEISGTETGCRLAGYILRRLYVDTAPVKGQARDITPDLVNLVLVE